MGSRQVAHAAHRAVTYHPDASALFAALGGTSRTDTVLLESADIDSKKNTACVAVLRGCLRVTCSGEVVRVEALTDVGQVLFDRLRRQLAGRDITLVDDGELTLRYAASSKADERARLLDTSNVEPLRLLQLEAGYQGASLPFLAGGFAFDYLETFEDLTAVIAGENTYPDYQFVVAEQLLRVDHLTHQASVEVLALSLEEAEQTVAALAETIAAFTPTPPEPPALMGHTLVATATVSDADFSQTVATMQEHIYQGDIYQVVPARSFVAPCPDAFAAYIQLRATNPSPYMFYQRGIDSRGRVFELLGASPESNLKFESTTRQVQVYPIAGTRPRGLNPDGSVNPELDIRAELAMRTDAKEVAEHIMLVDLARNDLARVAAPTTRQVVDLLQVDRYSRVMHLVSRVAATLHEDFDALDAYRACMNMGTLTGAPKLSAMHLLRGAEGVRRGSYGGAVGYLSGDGSMDTAIVIRAAFVVDGSAIVQAGAGVVRDSQPQAEANETLHKAYAVLHALALAQGYETVEVIR